MYVNQDTLDTRMQYAYLRHCDGEMALIVANFSDQAVSTAVRIPQHALDCAHIPQGKYTCKELLTNTDAEATLQGDSTFVLDLAPYSAAIWRFKKD